jgi:hypothetical protein
MPKGLKMQSTAFCIFCGKHLAGDRLNIAIIEQYSTKVF